ncbi:MAG: chorismate synthase [Opitutales bacterium]|nr:chorismate synthase [Opitutales bacterium]
MPNTFGKVFRITTWGESHGPALGAVVDGCPPNLPLEESDLQKELDRRRPGQSKIVTQRNEKDQVKILSGVYQGRTTGTPISLYISNGDHQPKAYDEMRQKFRPSHADFTYQTKYGHRNPEGGGRSSARETAARVAAAAIARKILASRGIEIRAYITRIHDISMPPLAHLPTLEEVEANPVRCPHPETAQKMEERILEVRKEGDSVGGLVLCRVQGLPVGLGDPVFDRLEADLAKAMLSLPATKGFAVGSGFDGTLLRGSEHNDPFHNQDGKIRTRTNHAGGVLGGISSGEELYFQVGFKPTATIIRSQATVDQDGHETELMGKGRHDPCVVPRAVPIVEAMTALVLLDHWMRHQAQCESFAFSQENE